MSRVEKRLRPARSRPVSCLFCRSRKLRCSRQFPCPNCTSRGIACDRDAPTATSINEAVEEESETPSGTFQQNVLSRLHRLERLVMGRGELSSPPSVQTGSQPSPPSLPRGDFFTGEKYSSVEFNWLEGAVTHPSPMSSLVSYELEFKACCIRSITSSELVLCKTIPGKVPMRTIWLPLYEEAKQIVDKYLTEITYIHHVVHDPSVREMLDDLYKNLNDQRPIKIGQVSLLLAILSSTTFFWTERDMHTPLFTSVEKANSQFTTWMKLALEVLEYSRRTRSDSLEDVQATIIVCFAICNVVGITSQVRSLFYTANSMAWNLGLHRIDHPHNEESPEHQFLAPKTVRAEIGRRVWWYLVATDWQASQFASPQKAIYSINPHQMATNKPLNANDEDLIDGMEGVDRPIDQPTSMSYCLQRIRLGELCREISDSIPFTEIGSRQPQYQRMRDIDSKLRDVARSLPSFFSLDFNIDKLPETDQRRKPGIIVQRYVINSLLHAQRCRMHLPYLSQATMDPAYSYSRDACMEAARMVIRTERQLAAEDVPFVLARLKFSGVLHCVCIAIIVLLMDLCRNKPHPESEGDRDSRVEIYNAFSILEEARGQSPFAGKILEQFYAILRRHNVPLPSNEGRPVTQPGNATEQTSRESINKSLPTKDNQMTIDGMLDPSLPSFDDLWQAFDTNVDPSSLVDWNELFSDLDSPFVSI